MRLYIEGHNSKKGYAISVEWSDLECSLMKFANDEELKPVRFISSIEKSKNLVKRFNSRYGTN